MSQLRDTDLMNVFASFIHDRIVTPGDGLIIFQGMQDSTAETIKSLEGFDIAWVVMHAADRFLKFAAECQAMAKSSRQQENKRVWNGLAERWLRCAKLLEQFETGLRSPELKRRQKHLKLVTH